MHRIEAMRLQNMLDSHPWGTIALDAAGCVLAASVRAEKLLGCAPEIGQPLHCALAHLPILSMVGAADLLFQGLEVERDGICLWIKLSPVPGDDCISATVAVIDITPLRREIDQRMASLRFLSHDLRSPQNSILALTELHDCDPSAFEACGGLQQIAQLARYSLALSADFIFSSLVGNVQRRDFTRFDLKDTVREIISQHEASAVYKGLSLQLSLPEETRIWAHGIRVFVARAIQNLLDNAISASRPGGLVIVSLKRNGDQADIVIRDWAGGLPGLPKHGRLTEFGEGSLGAGRGFGLGLKITSQIVRMHGGELFAESNSDIGTTFVLRLPCLGPSSMRVANPASGTNVNSVESGAHA
ncbi:MAG: HAMP domain-containing sensor histidine kinase [Pseudomonadota bacterium]